MYLEISFLLGAVMNMTIIIDLKDYILLFRVLFVSDDDTRVSLTHLPGVPGSDYINANYINVSITLF